MRIPTPIIAVIVIVARIQDLHYARGSANGDSARRDASGDDAIRSDDGAGTDGDTRKDAGIVPDPRAVSNVYRRRGTHVEQRPRLAPPVAVIGDVDTLRYQRAVTDSHVHDRGYRATTGEDDIVADAEQRRRARVLGSVDAIQPAATADVDARADAHPTSTAETERRHDPTRRPER